MSHDTNTTGEPVVEPVPTGTYRGLPDARDECPDCRARVGQPHTVACGALDADDGCERPSVIWWGLDRADTFREFLVESGMAKVSISAYPGVVLNVSFSRPTSRPTGYRGDVGEDVMLTPAEAGRLVEALLDFGAVDTRGQVAS